MTLRILEGQLHRWAIVRGLILACGRDEEATTIPVELHANVKPNAIFPAPDRWTQAPSITGG